MSRLSRLLRLAAGTILAASPFFLEGAEVGVAATNRLDLARAAETVEVPASALARWIAPGDLSKAALVDAGGRPVLAQAVDGTGDGVPDRLVFQSDFGPRQRKLFRVVPGKREAYRKEDFRVYGRLVRERFDDFAWENDRIAHRMYGAALETWQKEPLTSSTVDVWTKRTRRLVVNDWYMVDDYHQDHGEGADLYSAGRSRGCGGNGVWADGRLYPSRNFRGSRVLASGPIRLVFELTYEPWNAGGANVSETKRVTLDAGSNLNRFESVYTVTGGSPIAWAAGIRKVRDAEVRDEREKGWIRTWEPMGGQNGHLGCAVLADPASVASVVQADGNVLLVSKAGAPAVTWSGFGWDRSGDFASIADWDRYLEQAALRFRSPIEVLVEENPAP